MKSNMSRELVRVSAHALLDIFTCHERSTLQAEMTDERRFQGLGHGQETKREDAHGYQCISATGPTLSPSLPATGPPQFLYANHLVRFSACLKLLPFCFVQN